MKNKYLILIAVLTLVFTVSCKKNNKEIEETYLTSLLNETNIDNINNYNYVVILPGLGCSGCIQEGEAFMKKNIDNKQILFILTKVESLKILQRKIDIKIKNYANIFVDKNDVFKIPTNNNIYPCLVHIENGKVKSHEFQAPDNNAFDNLKNRL